MHRNALYEVVDIFSFCSNLLAECTDTGALLLQLGACLCVPFGRSNESI